MELKNSTKWGILLGYLKSESIETKIVETNQTTNTSDGAAMLMATTYFGFRLSTNVLLMPQITYATILDREFNNGIYQINIDRSDSWKAGLAARLNF